MGSNYELFPHQEQALKRLKSGSILNGGVGSGKTITSLVFYKTYFSDRKLIVITTAKKRDSGDWEEDAEKVGVKIERVDSWNNITNYLWFNNVFFIFDEQRVVGYSTWGKSFIKICRNNKWILLTATPGDNWLDYMPVFIANGFYRNKTDFIDQHVEFDQYVKYPKVKKFHNPGKLIRYRNSILIPMDFKRSTTRIRRFIKSQFDKELYETVLNNRWNIFTDKPVVNASELMQCLRRIVASDYDRMYNAKFLMDIHDRVIVFYNYDYELDILKGLAEELGKEYWEWNGHRHENIPDKDQWLYLVQYTAGAEGWNCISTNVILFYSLNYSYKITEQAEGRIDRLNTTYTDLEYYYLTSDSAIDKSVRRSLTVKEKFNESAWLKNKGVII
jgi:hypothetical protein